MNMRVRDGLTEERLLFAARNINDALEYMTHFYERFLVDDFVGKNDVETCVANFVKLASAALIDAKWTLLDGEGAVTE